MRGRGVAQGRGASFAKKSTASRLGRWLKLPTKTTPARPSNGAVVGAADSCALAITAIAGGSRPSARSSARSARRSSSETTTATAQADAASSSTSRCTFPREAFASTAEGSADPKTARRRAVSPACSWMNCRRARSRRKCRSTVSKTSSVLGYCRYSVSRTSAKVSRRATKRKSYGSRSVNAAIILKEGITCTPSHCSSLVYRSCAPFPERFTVTIETWQRIASSSLIIVSERIEPESRSGSGSTWSIHSTRKRYMRVAAMCVYMVLCGCRHAAATSHGGIWWRSCADHLDMKCWRFRSISASIEPAYVV